MPTVQCYHCSKSIYKRPRDVEKSKSGLLFCSNECYKYHRSPESTCQKCGIVLTGRNRGTRKFCSYSCSNGSRRGEKRPGNSQGRASRNLRLKAVLAEDRGLFCEVCRYDRVLVVHHLVEVASGGDDSLDNLMLICPNCHGEIHGKIDGEAFVESLNRLARLASASQTNC